MYMYFGFRTVGLEDPVKVYEHIEEEARKAMLKSGGSLSHHHGIGKLRKNFLPQVMSPCGLEMIKGLKDKIDPMNIFATNNIIDATTPAKPTAPEEKKELEVKESVKQS